MSVMRMCFVAVVCWLLSGDEMSVLGNAFCREDHVGAGGIVPELYVCLAVGVGPKVRRPKERAPEVRHGRNVAVVLGLELRRRTVAVVVGVARLTVGLGGL